MLSGFDREQRTYLEKTRDVYFAGAGPGIVVVSEVPGITPEVAAFAKRVVDAGFRVAMPDVLGDAGRKASAPYVLRSITGACISREFTVLAQNRRSPITDWIRELGRALFESCGGKGIGAIGMCLTGNFALGLMLDAHMQAPVLSQPSTPFPVSRRHKAAIGVSEADLAVLRTRVRDEGVPILGLRFTHDALCPKARFDSLRREFGSAFEAIEIDSGPGNHHGISRMAHSVLAGDFVDEQGHPTHEAMLRVLDFFRERLAPD